MLCENSLPRYFWAEAINTVSYILNRALVRPILKKTFYELWKGRRPNISYFHIFRCKCFIHNNNKDNLEKFNARSDEGIFLGYSTTSKAYRVFNKKILVVEKLIHVTFDESNHKSLDRNIEDDENLLEDKAIDSNDHISQDKKIDNSKNNEEIEDESLSKSWKYKQSHPKDLIIGDTLEGIKIRSSLRNINNYLAFI